MSAFLTKIHVNKVFHLEDITIDIDAKEKKHLILTGKNGSGKTSVLNAVKDVLQIIKNDTLLDFFQKPPEYPIWEKFFEDQDDMFKSQLKEYYGRIDLDFINILLLSKKLQEGNFLLAYYGATRKMDVSVPKNPDKPNLDPINDIKESKIGEFLKFLVDLKVQEALARNENQQGPADEIKNWFANFTAILQQVFEGDPITLEFNYKDYSFTINQKGQRFGFSQLSDGYSAIIDIVADLIIKMQDQNSLTRAYEKEGIVLIDEVETHLHLKLQRLIMPMLTQIFPNIQFIVTTHSPFVLSSLKNAVAFDLEKGLRLEDLTEYSYEALTEGYFKVTTDSNFLLTKLDRFKELSEIPQKDSAELAEYENLDSEFADLNETLASPAIKGQYLQIKLSAK